MSVAVVSPSRASADDELQRSVSNLTLSSSSSSIAATDADADNTTAASSDTFPASSSSSSTPPATVTRSPQPPPSSASSNLSTAPSPQPAPSSAPVPASSSAPLYVPPPSSALPSSSPYLPASLRAAPGQTLTVEGSDSRRHTYDDEGRELGNDPATGYYEEVEIEDMDWEADGRRWTYPCPCGDRFVLTADELMDGECIARCPSCSLVIKVIYDPEDVFEQEGDSDDD